jgi:hypothetical protein
MDRKKKDKHVPKEVRAVREARQRRRLWAGFGFLGLWWLLFIIGLVTGSDFYLWVGWIAVSGEVIALYGLHEKALRKLADRPTVDYDKLHALKKEEKKTRPLAIAPDAPDPELRTQT